MEEETVSIEEKIRNAVVSRRARTDDYLKDFDRLRTGLITKAQFERCLDQHYSVILKPNEHALLMEKYGDVQNPGMVNYRNFCKAIDTSYDLSSTSDEAKPTPVNTLDAKSLERVEQLLERIAPYYKYHGISIRSCYEDFDQHNIGLVTESQFYRRFPGPPDVFEEEQNLLAKKYLHPHKKGLLNYLEFHLAMEEIKAKLDSKTVEFLSQFEDTSSKNVTRSSLEEIFNKIQVAVHKHGIRTTEFFKDHDKLRSGVITRNQFVCGLTLCCGTQAYLSHDDVNMLVEYYQTDDGRVRYKDFCHVMENAFNVPNLEKEPTTDVYRPPTGALAKAPNNLSNEEEERVRQILYGLRETVRKKRLMLYPYFKDFDRGNCYTRGITKTQFNRMLHMVGLDLPQCDLNLVYRKFEYPASGDVNYPAFIQSIDQEYCGKAPVTGNWNTTQLPFKEKETRSGDTQALDVDELIKRIRHNILVNRIRVEEFFQDFDPLRHGSISVSRFRMGLSAMGQQYLKERQIQAIIDRYMDPNKKWNVLWTSFLNDIEQVFTLRGLEKKPTVSVPPSEEFFMAKPGAQNWSEVDQLTKQAYQEVMSRLRQKSNQRRILCKPCFQDFDRHNQGYVTNSQLFQCMTYLCLDCNQQEIDLLCLKFSDDKGFNYTMFLEELQPSEKLEQKYIKRLDDLKLASTKNNNVEPPAEDINIVMDKIKSKVFREAVHIYEFMKDYDKLRAGRMLKTSFPRALDLCAFNLTPVETNLIMEWYTCDGQKDYVDYYRFCEDIESVFTTKGLEKNPTLVPTQFEPNAKNFLIRLSPDAEEMLETVMHRLADRVRIRRIQMFPLFEDYDRVHNGTVSRSQLHRVLSELELGSLVSAREFHVLYEKFDSVIGGKHDFNYIAFCDMLNDYAQFEPHIP